MATLVMSFFVDQDPFGQAFEPSLEAIGPQTHTTQQISSGPPAGFLSLGKYQISRSRCNGARGTIAIFGLKAHVILRFYKFDKSFTYLTG